MGYSFDTIDGLFRPNYRVYQAFNITQQSDPQIIESELSTYKPNNLERVKSVIVETPSQQDKVEEPIQTETQDESEDELSDYKNQSNYRHFTSELDKFITKNPKYQDIKKPLQYLAALESAYTMDITNNSGSSALGWFQFTDATRKNYGNWTREQFAKDPQAQLSAAARHYTQLQKEISKRGGDPDDFALMYGAWWRPDSAYAYLKNPKYDFKTQYGESFQQILRKARNLLNKNGKSNS